MFNLSEREKIILRDIIHQFILTANPVGSRNLAKRSNLNLSAATIRNIMADLEEEGFLQHPHTSAGRIPTDLGYRFYVDSLMTPINLNFEELKLIENEIEVVRNETDHLLQLTATILSKITNQLACVTYPNISNAILEKIQIVSLSNSRILVIVEIKSGLVKTITLEIDSSIDDKHIYLVQQFLNERLSGLKFCDIKETFTERISNFNPAYNPIIRVFVDSLEKIFTDDGVKNKLFIAGTNNILKQPEFETQELFEGIIELIENHDVIIHIMEKKKSNSQDDLVISIGQENENDKLTKYSLVKKTYELGTISGNLGIIGPKRMEYSKTIAAVIYIAELLTNEFKNN